MGYSKDTAHHLQFDIILPFMHVSLLICVCVHLCVSDGAHVFMHSGAPVQLVTLPQRVAPRNTTDVQMFLLGKQTEQRPFYSGQRDCQNKSWPPLDLSSNSDSLIHRQITICSLLSLFCRMFVVPAFGYIKFTCVSMYVCTGPSSIVLECRAGTLRMMVTEK